MRRRNRWSLGLFTVTVAIACSLALSQGAAAAAWQRSFTGNGLSSSANAVAMYKGDVIVGGWFATAGGTTVDCIARWDGSRWNSMNGGMLGNPPRVVALAIYDGSLYAAGGFTIAGGVAANNIAQWDGENWKPVDSGISGIVNALTVYDGKLIVGGLITMAGGTSVHNIASWDGSRWSALGDGRPEQVLSLAVLDDTLYAGSFYDWEHPEPLHSIAAWNGSAWKAVGNGLPYSVQSLCSYSQPYETQDHLVAGGFHHHLSRWSGTAWSDYGDPLEGTTFGTFEMVLAMVRSGSDLYVAGHFLNAGGQLVNHIARWDGTQYHPLGGGLYTGNGPDDDAFGSGLVYDGVNLYVAGSFAFSDGNRIRSANIAKWGSANEAEPMPPALDIPCSLSAYPTPANPKVTLSYSLEQPGSVLLRIYDIRGLQTATVRDGYLPAGDHHDEWDGRTSTGGVAPSGLYFAVLENAGNRVATKIILAR